jgi:CDP-glucose 4,6-dehydratase
MTLNYPRFHGCSFNTLMNLAEFYAGKKVLISGHSGFKGSWLSFTLNWMKAEVYGYSTDEPNNHKHAYHALGIPSIVNRLSTCQGDVRTEHYADFIDDVRPDVIFHLAAQAIVAKGYEDPFETISTNTFGVLNILDYLRIQSSAIPTVIITSDKCYNNLDQGVPFIESDNLGGSDPYSASKAAAENLFGCYLSSFYKKSKKPVATARAGNVFGGGDCSPNRLIPDAIHSILTIQKVFLRMPLATRPWTLVHDVLKGYLLLGKLLSESPADYMGSWNFASEEVMSVSEISNCLVDYFTTDIGEIDTIVASNNISENSLLQLNSAKARNMLDWDCRVELRQAIQETAKWYACQHKGENMADYSRHYLEGIY